MWCMVNRCAKRHVYSCAGARVRQVPHGRPSCAGARVRQVLHGRLSCAGARVRQVIAERSYYLLRKSFIPHVVYGKPLR